MTLDSFSPPRAHRLACLALLATTVAACDPAGESSRASTGSLIHLTESLAEATIESATAPVSAREKRDWVFPAALDEWRPLGSPDIPRLATVDIELLDDGARLALGRPARQQSMLLIGGIAIDVDGLRLGDWETVLVRARSSDRLGGLTVTYNVGDATSLPNDLTFFFSTGDVPPVFSDGSEQVYALPIRVRGEDSPDTTVDSLAVIFGGPDEAAVDVLSVSLVPRGASYLDDHGVGFVTRSGFTRTTLFTHAPSRLTWDVDIAAGARLDVALTAEVGDEITYRVGIEDGGEVQTLFEQSVTGSPEWTEVSVDLTSVSGRGRQLVLEASSANAGAVAFWGMPMLSSPKVAERPNVIFYVIDGGGADLMSLYGYERPTTPYLEELAAEGAVFERAFSNSTWTQPSTASFMTSLHHSVLGGLRRGIHSTPIPEAARTMAEHLRTAGYQTMSYNANPNAGRLIRTERGVDVIWDTGPEHHSTSSKALEEAFWANRESFPGEPYWVHFQTTDVHEPNEPEAPWAGMFVDPEDRQKLPGWDQQLFIQGGAMFGQTSVSGFYDFALEKTGIDRQEYFGVRKGLYDETMVHQDHQLEQLVNRLKAEGEWENTLLIIGADHGHPAGTFARFGRGLFDPQPAAWEGALFDAYATRVPLMMIWPGGIEAGLRFDQPVSMIDVLPTLLDLLDLPAPEVLQGQSLAPLLRGESQEVRPVILDEFRVHEATGEMLGNLDIVDGRWGATLEIGPLPEGVDPESGLGRHAVPVGGRWGAVHPFFPDVPRLLLYDLDNDPFATRAVNDEHPDLVEMYRAVLLEQWQAHQALALQFGEVGDVALSPDQLDQLRALGYIQ